MPLSAMLLRSSGLITVAPEDSKQRGLARIALSGNDDASDINNILDMLPNGAEIIILDGTVNLSSPVRPKSKRTMRGNGQATVFTVTGDINAFENTESLEWFQLRDIAIDMNRQQNAFVNGGVALHLMMTHSTIQRLNTMNAKNNLLLNFDDFVSDDSGLLNRIEHCNFQDSTDLGVGWGWRTTDSWFCFNNVGSLGPNIKIQGSVGRFIGNHFDGGVPEYNVYMPDGARNMLFQGNIIEQGAKGGIYASGALFNVIISENVISNTGRESGGYDHIHIEGLMDGIDNSKTINITNNIFKKNDDNLTVRHCVYAKQTTGISIMGNGFEGYNAEDPIGIDTATVTNYEVVGNCGNNTITAY